MLKDQLAARQTDRISRRLTNVRTAIRHVENNSIKLGLPRQRWPFVIPYDNWPLHKRQE